MSLIPSFLLCLFLSLFVPLSAGAEEKASKAIPQHLAKKELSPKEIETLLLQKIPKISLISIEVLPEFGMYKVITDDFTSIFITLDGSNFIIGERFSFDKTGNLKNLSREEREIQQFALTQQIPKDEMIIFPALDKNNKPVKSDIWVLIFTDIDCGYCRKFHREIEEVNKLGIEVRYVFFPRSGPDTESYYKAVSVWCAEDKQSSMTAAKAGLPLASKTCPNPVNEQLDLGKKSGVKGTPTMWTSAGKRIPGYVPAKRLLSIIQS